MAQDFLRTLEMFFSTFHNGQSKIFHSPNSTYILTPFYTVNVENFTVFLISLY
jgi:hypothetical protein